MSDMIYLMADNLEGSGAKMLEASDHHEAIEYCKEAANDRGRPHTLFKLVAEIRPGVRREAVVIDPTED